MSLAATKIDDLVALTLEKLIKEGAFVDMQTDLQDHVAMREMWKGMRKVFDGGLEWRFDIQMDHNYSTRAVGLYETDGSSVQDTMVKGKVPVRHVNSHFIYDLREPDFQRGGLAIVNFLMTKKAAMMVSFFEKGEEFLWGKPVDSSDEITPWGLAYWLTRGATEGFTGGNPAGFSDGKAGLSQSTYSRWANWSAAYATISKQDLVRKMRKAARQTKFRSPLSHAVPNLRTGNGIYTNDSVIGLLEEILEDQNMNLGNDLASKDGRTLFKGTPITYAPYLDGDSTDPIMFIDWNTMAVGSMAGWENNMTKPYMVPNKHNVRRVDLDVSFNMVSTDLRKHAIFFKS